MLFHRDPYYDRSPIGCFGTLILCFFLALFIALAAIYLGIYFLIAMLIIGCIVGGMGAIYALFKSIPQIINDMRTQYFKGSKLVVALKNIGYLFICIGKYSISNDFQFAKNAFMKFKNKRVLSFSKWINLALSFSVMVFGILILLGILTFAFVAAAFLLIHAAMAMILLIALLMIVSLVYNIYVAIKGAVLNWGTSFLPIALKFRDKCYFSDIVAVPRTLISQLGAWLSSIWKYGINSITHYKSWMSSGRKILIPISIAMIISSPMATTIIVALVAVLTSIILLVAYLVDAIWIIIKSLLKL